MPKIHLRHYRLPVMTQLGRIVLFLGAMTIVIMGLYPPWIATGKANLSPLEYYVKHQIRDVEDALDIYNDVDTTDAEREKLAPLVLEKDESYTKQLDADRVPKSKADRVEAKVKRAQELRLWELGTQQRPLDTAPSTISIKDAGYHFIFESPARDIDNIRWPFRRIYSINVSRLIAQWAIVALFTLGMLWAIRTLPRLRTIQNGSP